MRGGWSFLKKHGCPEADTSLKKDNSLFGVPFFNLTNASDEAPKVGTLVKKHIEEAKEDIKKEKEELSKEEAIRGADGTISGCLMIEATVESSIRMITKQIAKKITDDAEVGFYQLICTLENKNIC